VERAGGSTPFDEAVVPQVNTPEKTAADATGDRPDGRVLRGQRNRDALLRAYTELLADGVWQPRAQDIAERAGVSVRSLFQHFPDLRALRYVVVVDRFETAKVFVDDLEDELRHLCTMSERVEATVRMRGHLWESCSPLRPVLLVPNSDGSNHDLTELVCIIRSRLREQLRRTFAQEIAADDDSFTKLAAVQAALGFEMWEHLRFSQRLDNETTLTVMRHMVLGALISTSASR
jgi:AcrR family transcriptional regulator